MGKPKGDAGRSKARPSSSSLAASLLQADSTAAVGFGGYVGSSRLQSPLPASRDDVSPYSDIDSELVQHLKRLARKDPTTKLKALASLSTLFKQKPGKDIVPAIPLWAFEYKRLLMDYNREVRRATGEAMTQLVSSVGRDLAPHLKTLMGPWWFSQFDPDYEASQAAKRSLQAAFPAPEKRLDALFLCTTEIFAYLEENLKLTPQDLFDKASATDELKDMHQQVISSSLLALATLLDVSVSSLSERPGFENVAAEPKHSAKARAVANTFADKLFFNHKCFMDFLKSQSSAIRLATYSVLRSFIRNIPHVFSDESIRTLSPMLLGTFQEKDPTCHPPMWEVILLFSRRFPICWTHLNVQKVVTRLWNFLRNGCFGSQVSYSALVIFLDSLPLEALEGEKFLEDLLVNLWNGRNAFLSSNGDVFTFFQGFKECFIWAIKNTSRHLNELGSVSPARAKLVENILVKYLWEEFIHFPLWKCKGLVSSMSCETSEDSSLSIRKRTQDASIAKSSEKYLHELGKCIVHILSGIDSVENDQLSVFCSAFEEACQQMLMHCGDGEPEIIEHLIQFLSLLEHESVRKGEIWPLIRVLAPALARHFSPIESLDKPSGMTFLSAAVTVCGVRQIVQALSNRQTKTFCSAELDKELESEQFMHIFKERFVPWCLERNDSYTAARVDFLLTLLVDECFPEQWSSILSYVVKLEITGVGIESLHPDSVAVLAVLLQRAREKILGSKMKKHIDYLDSYSNCWHHKLLDSAAVAVVSSAPPFPNFATEFLCLSLGGATEIDQISFVSGDACDVIFNSILEKLISVLMVSPLTWAKETGLSLRIREKNIDMDEESSDNRIEIAKFALGILYGSLYTLTNLDEANERTTNILAAVFIISWEYRIECLLDEALNHELSFTRTRSEVYAIVQSLFSKINKKFCQNLGVQSREKLRIMLAQSIRSAIFIEQQLDPNKLTDFCCTWMLAVVDCFCVDEHEEQHLLEHLLLKGDGWPFWISKGTFRGSGYQQCEDDVLHEKVYQSQRLVSLVDKLIQERGIGRIIGSSVLPLSPLSNGTVNYESRAWLAAEMLCTWEWPGGSAVTSFLPALGLYFKNDATVPRGGHLLNSVVDILLDNALAQGKTTTYNFSDTMSTTLDEQERTEEPFLRALISLLDTLFRHKIWGSDEARTLFELLVVKMFVGETVNLHCLRILPPIVSTLVLPLYQRERESSEECHTLSPGEDQVHITLIHWLERALSFPPLLMWQSGQDMQEWLLLVISCYPVTANDRLNAPEPGRKISLQEKTLLLDLFHKQRGIGMLTTSDHLELSQVLLSRLIAISSCYCGQHFSEEDWDFVLSLVKMWIQWAVVMMEDVAENVNDVITSMTTTDVLDTVMTKLENIIPIKDQHRVDIARSAILTFFSFCRIQEVKVIDDLSSLAAERWDTIKDRISEAILRIFFCSGLSEAIANLYTCQASSVVASSRLYNLFFWKLVAWGAILSSPQCRERAANSVDFWGLSRGYISSLYAILFSSTPIPVMQFAAYVILSTDPIAPVAIGEYVTSNLESDKDSGDVHLMSEQNVHLRVEISCMIEHLPCEVLEMDMLAPERVHILLSWCILLSHLWSLPLSSPARERLVQHIQNSVDTVILDILFQYIFLDVDAVCNLRKRDKALPTGLGEAANVANEAILTGSVLSLIESFWPIEQLKMTLLAAAIYGMMLRLLPAYVRGWFSSLRDRSTSSAVECFTRTWCSPPLIGNELSQIKRASFVDENFSVSVSKAANEVVATYMKDETGVDLVIRLPASYPLRPVDVDCTRSLGISELKQRKWLMSMMLFLSNQNGAIAEAIRIWKCNFDKEFEGVEECPICYSVIHTSNHSLPRYACKTCKHKYHSACLNKWFSTSNKRTCPLCQSLF